MGAERVGTSGTDGRDSAGLARGSRVVRAGAGRGRSLPDRMVVAALLVCGVMLVSASPAWAYPGTDTTVDAECYLDTIEGSESWLHSADDTVPVPPSAGDQNIELHLVFVCDVHDELVNALMVLASVVVFGVGFAVVTVAVR